MSFVINRFKVEDNSPIEGLKDRLNHITGYISMHVYDIDFLDD